MWDYLLGAFALMLVFESLFPLLVPEKWRRTLETLLRQDITLVRRVAFGVFLLGAFLLYLASLLE
jgi:uncharacterized protein YjeT (DUF2065 family)